mmetsp:Transcript_92415/g.298698  ORF Transcript_92415/g.298698 Transcript_92415/m.298698 type:complete len:368 (-) Transcript_92415:168-1271(-)
MPRAAILVNRLVVLSQHFLRPAQHALEIRRVAEGGVEQRLVLDLLGLRERLLAALLLARVVRVSAVGANGDAPPLPSGRRGTLTRRRGRSLSERCCGVIRDRRDRCGAAGGILDGGLVAALAVQPHTPEVVERGHHLPRALQAGLLERPLASALGRSRRLEAVLIREGDALGGLRRLTAARADRRARRGRTTGRRGRSRRQRGRQVWIADRHLGRLAHDTAQRAWRLRAARKLRRREPLAGARQAPRQDRLRGGLPEAWRIEEVQARAAVAGAGRVVVAAPGRQQNLAGAQQRVLAGAARPEAEDRAVWRRNDLVAMRRRARCGGQGGREVEGPHGRHGALGDDEGAPQRTRRHAAPQHRRARRRCR